MLRTAGVAVTLALAFSALAGCAGANHSGSDGTESHAKTYRDGLGWSLRYPGGMHLERSKIVSFVSIHEVTVANFEARRPIRSTSNAHGSSIGVDPPRPAHGVFPSDGVAFRVFQLEGGPGPDLERPETRLPLHLDALRPSPEYPSTLPRPLGKAISAAGRNYAVYAWVGPHALPQARSSLRSVVRSLAFPRLRTGTVAGYGFSVLDRARSYPVGSFTRVQAQGQRLYLVHAPGGFYAVGCCWSMTPPRPQCDVRLDRSLEQFFCANLEVRWDRMGRPKRRGDEPLSIATTKSSWDGHVLLYPGSTRTANRRLAATYWPHWAGR